MSDASHNVPYLSIVIPVYNEAHRLSHSLSELSSWLPNLDYAAELIWVDDGSSDDTMRLLQQHPIANSRLVALKTHSGPGAAARAGVSCARGTLILIMDADCPTPLEEVCGMIAEVEAGADLVIGSRHQKNSKILAAQPVLRKVASRVYRDFVRRRLKLDWSDTQCGFKLFRGDIGKELFGATEFNSFAFYVEVLLLAYERNLRIVEYPIAWSHRAGSRISLIRDAWHMFRDVRRLKAVQP